MPYNTTNEQLSELFSEHGNISEVKIITDQISNRSKGFGFITFEDAESCQSAIDALNGFEFNGRTLKVNMAEDKSTKKREYSQYNNNRRKY
jgi:RNA recognition motif-containing protein